MALRAWLLFALALSASFAPTARAADAPVRVTSDTGFTSALWDGNGTEDDPYVPTFRSIVAAGGYGVELSGTQAHVNLTGLTITGGGTSHDAIRLYSVRNVTVYGNTLETNRYGIHVRSSSDVVLAGNTVKTSQVGVFLEGSSDVDVRDNRLSLNERDVQLKTSSGNAFDRNNLSVATGQYGLWFDDNTSYDNEIATSNVVNAIPVRWYTRLEGEADDPVVISDVTVDLPRMTNVAQIMVYRSSYVTLERATAKAGAGAGIQVYRSAVVDLVRPTTDGNAASGIFLELTNDTTISNASSRNNTLHGVHAQSSRDTLLEWSTATGNRGQGVRVSASARDTTLHQLTLASNAQGGVVADRASGLALDESALTSNGPTAVSLETTTGVEMTDVTVGGTGTTAVLVARSRGTFDDVTVTGHTTGFSFVASTGSNVSASTVTLPRGGTGFAFDGPQSYDNEVSTTNLVNGTPVRWYTNLVGPLALDGLEVEQAGITNVGQIVLYKTRNVTLSDAVARNGTAAGIALYLANDTTIERANVSQNTAQGVLATSSLRLDLHESTLENNTGDGAKLVGSHLALLENNVLDDGGARGIAVETSSTPTLRGNAITGHAGAGVYFDRVGPGGAAADHNVLEDNAGGGIVATNSVVGTLYANTLDSNGADGIALSSTPAGARIDANEIVDHTRGIRLTRSGGVEVTATTITFGGAAQTGIHFDDEDSYNASIATSTLVEGAPVHWYFDRHNETIEAPAVELAGITNVAQVMLFRSDNVTIEGALAANGTARGVYLLRVDNVTLANATALDNARAGIAVETTKAVRIDDARSEGNAQEGALLKGAGASVVANSTLLENGGAGVSIDTSPSPGAVLENLTVEGNVMGIVAASAALAKVHNNSIVDNGARGLSLSLSSGANVTANAIEEHAHGVHLARVSGTRFEDNFVAVGAGQTAWWFEDENAYANTVDETNLVNDVPMRWYADHDELTLTDVVADEPGMTNVAQVMVYRSNESVLTNVTAANGSARGIMVLRSDDVEVADSAARDNTGDGLQLNVTARAHVHGLEASGNGGAGARIGGTSPTLEGSTFRANALAGIVVEGGTDILVEGNDVADERVVGIALRNSTAAPVVRANVIDNATQGIAFLASEYAVVEDNVITKSASQFGLWFSDERSYNNVIGTSNTVDGEAVRWYTTLAGTEADPVVLTDVRSELRGITNVAQVMLYRSAYVELPGVVATNGTARGVYLYRSSAITLEDANATSNALYGVHLQATQSSRVAGLAAQGSATGVRINESHNNVVTGVNASGATAGVSIDASSRDNRIDNVTASGTARGVVDAGWNGASLLGANVALDGGATKRVKAGNALVFNDTMATYRLEASRVVSQSLELGDGSALLTSTASAPLRPSHTYADEGVYVANLTAQTVDGITLVDSVLVEVVSPLTAPQALRATPGGRNITLTWAPPVSDGAATITKYRVYRGVNNTDVPYLGEVSGTTLSYLDAGLENGKRYTYRVSAVNADGQGPNATASGTPVSTPSAPTSFAAASLPNGSRLTWGAPTDTGGQRITGYDVFRAVEGGAFSLFASIGNATEYRAIGLTNGVNYTFTVRARSPLGEGALAANATVMPLGPPAAPLKVKALGGDASATLVWSAPREDGGTAVTGYRVWRGSSNDTLTELPATISVDFPRHRDTGLSNGATYVYAVAAVNAVGQGERSAGIVVVPSAVDSLRPVLFDLGPDEGALLVESPPSIAGRYVDNEGIVLGSVRVYLDGSQVEADVEEDGFAYALAEPLGLGTHTVRVVLRDPEGNEADESWSFRILSEEERVPRFESSGHELVPARAPPGANVTARLAVRNVGYAAGNVTIALLLGQNALGFAEATLGIGESVDLAIAFDAPTVLGAYDLTLDDEPLVLTVAEGEPEAPPEEEPAPTPTSPAQPERPPRDDNVTPRELPAETPGLGPALIVALVASLAWWRRKR